MLTPRLGTPGMVVGTSGMVTPLRSSREEAILDLRSVLHEKLQDGVDYRVLKRWSSLGLPVDVSECSAFKPADGTGSVTFIPQLETVVINQT